MNSPVVCHPSKAKLLREFDRELAGGGEPAWDSFLSRCPDNRCRAELCADLISCEVEHRGWDAEAVRNRLRLYSKYDSSETGAAVVVRGIYADRLEAGEHPILSEFETLGLDFDLLQLRTDEEAVYLGQIIAERYRVEERLGMGSFGIVYRGTDATENCVVAVKAVRVTGDEQEKVARLLLEQEADLLAKLPVDGIPRLIGFLKTPDGQPVLIRDFVDGQTIHQLVQHGPLAPERAAAIAARLADTLQFAHRRGFLHRDLSASNVLIDETDTPFLMDFGLGIGQGELFDRTRHAAGTRSYMSVESLIGATREIDARDDIWSLGVILYELLTGRSRTTNVARANASESAREFEKEVSGSNIPPLLRSICQRCVADDADDRYDTAGLLARELRSFLGESLTPLNEARVELAQRRLWAWRAGMSFGNAYRSQAYARWRLEQLLSGSAADLQTSSAATQLIFASTKTVLDEFVKCTALTSRLGLTLAKLTGVSEFVSAYNHNRTRPDLDTCRWLCDFLAAAGSTVFGSYQQLETQLSVDGSSMIALLKLALAGGSRALGANVPQGLAALTEGAGLPQHATARYITCVSGNPDTDEHEREVDRLRKSVERELMHQIADALGDPTGTASPHSTNS